MGSVNKVILIGNLGRDPETRFTGNGTAVTNFTMATTERRKQQDGQWGEQTTWHRIVAFDRLAELCQQYLSKGRQVYVEGRIQMRKYTDRDGAERTSTEIIAREITFLQGGSAGGGRGGYSGGGGGGRPDSGGGDQGGGRGGGRGGDPGGGGGRSYYGGGDQGGGGGRPQQAPQRDGGDVPYSPEDDDIPF